MRRIFTILGCALLLSGSGPAVAESGEPVVLTVTGAIERTNRPSFDPFADALFGALGETFEKAYPFTRGELLALPQIELTLKYPNWPAELQLAGPLLTDVLDTVGARGDTIRIQSIDGYAPEFRLEEVRSGTFVLALAANGDTLTVGGRGPVWLVFPMADHPEQPVEDDGGLAWAAFHVAVARPGD